MQDEIYDRYYQAGHADLHAGLDFGFQALGHVIARAVNALHDVRFDAPWQREPRCPDRAGLA